MRQKLLVGLSHFITRYPGRMLGILLLITAVFMVMMTQLEFSTSMTNLMPQDDPKVVEFDRIMEEYNGAASLLIVAEGDPEHLLTFADEVSPRIEAIKDYVKKVDYKQPRELIENHALMLMKSQDLENIGDVFTDPNLTRFLANLNDSFEKEYIQSDEKISGQEQEQSVIRFMDGIQTFVTTTTDFLQDQGTGAGAETAADRAVDAVLLGDLYYRSWDREMLIMQIIPDFNWMDVEKSVFITDTVETIIKDVAAQEGISAGLTGVIPLSRDEMRAMENDSFVITTVAVIAIFILFMIAFRMFTSPFLAILTLILGVIWAMGLAWVIVGSLNIMTSMMSVILVGLGIDFSVHLIAGYSERRAAGESIESSLTDTLTKSGMGIITGGFTTAAAFFTMVISRTEGMREFGLVLGEGIVIIMVATLLILPTLLVLKDRLWGKLRKVPSRQRDISYRFLGASATALAKNKYIGLAALIVVTLFLGYRGFHLTMDYNYLNMEPAGLESVFLQDRIIDKMDISADYCYITVKDLNEAEAVTEKAKAMSTSGMVQSIVDFLPPPEEQQRRTEKIHALRTKLDGVDLKTALTPADRELLLAEIERLEMNVMEIQDMAVIGGQDKIYLKTGLLVGVVPEEEDASIMALQEELVTKQPSLERGLLTELRETVAGLSTPGWQKMDSFQQAFAAEFKAVARRMTNTEPITIATLPPSIRAQFVGKSGDSFLVTVFPKDNVWDIDFLERFTRELEDVSPRVTGIPPVFKRLMEYFAADGKQATYLALVVIFIILVLDFHSWRKSALAMAPLIIGVFWMIGLMQLTGLQLTMVNIMAIPLIIGIGIDDGVHVMHRYNIEGRDKHFIVFSTTGRAILLTSLTTMLGFGSLIFATYRGLGSMGSALFIGVGTCFLATVLVIPALMGVYHAWHTKKST
ncbi:MAG: RND family transporter [Fidelibacterota bacterium]